MDKNRKAEEVYLSPMDFLSAPAAEVDLRQLGIKVADDPTLGNKAEGDIATPNFKRLMDETMGIARNSIRQTYR